MEESHRVQKSRECTETKIALTGSAIRQGSFKKSLRRNRLPENL